MKAAVIYNSQKGKTKKYAMEIQAYLKEKKIETTLSTIEEADNNNIENSDVIFLGCWTAGLFLFLQGPEKKWINFAVNLPSLKGKKVILFTTYLLATGSMFANMKKHIDADKILAEMKSKTDTLCEKDKLTIDSIIEK